MKTVFLALLLGGWPVWAWAPAFTGPDAKRPRISVQLTEWARGLLQVTDIQFPPGRPDEVYVLLKTGEIYRLSRKDPTQRSKILQLAVLRPSELGLLGLAFHPDFATNKKLYLNYNPASGAMRTRISEWVVNESGIPEKERILLEVNQPFSNHDAGQLLFGSDRFLYIGLGDGGSGGDPYNHAQDTRSLLGKMLRIDPDKPAAGKAYGIPSDNPFVLKKEYSPEIWALGLRNPWRYSWDPQGRLIVADVGQDAWEEVSIVEAGKNYGWRVREAAHCYPPGITICKDFVAPWLEYARDEGVSITGGFVSMAANLPALQGKYVFGDFGSGRLWAADLPAPGKQSQTTHTFATLGRWPMTPSTFGQGPDGEIYVGDFTSGKIYRLDP